MMNLPTAYSLYQKDILQHLLANHFVRIPLSFNHVACVQESKTIREFLSPIEMITINRKMALTGKASDFEPLMAILK
jgi:hypothetical protein